MMNVLIRESTACIQTAIWPNEDLSVAAYKKTVLAQMRIERGIAEKNAKIHKFLDKWLNADLNM